jgi:hypothetical protein
MTQRQKSKNEIQENSKISMGKNMYLSIDTGVYERKSE